MHTQLSQLLSTQSAHRNAAELGALQGSHFDAELAFEHLLVRHTASLPRSRRRPDPARLLQRYLARLKVCVEAAQWEADRESALLVMGQCSCLALGALPAKQA